VLDLERFDPRTYIEAIGAAAAAGYDVLVIDSLSHAWSGKGGALELVDQAARRAKSGNTFAAWREVTPLHNALVDAILQAPLHVIATLRAKTEYVLEADPKSGRQTPRKVGLAPVQRDGLEYEFDVVADMDPDNVLVVSKTRCPALAQAVIPRPDADLGRRLAAWLSDGADPAAAAPVPAPMTDAALAPPAMPDPVAAADIADGVISFAQAKALTVLAKQHHRLADVRDWLRERYGLTSSLEIPLALHDEIHTRLADPRPLPLDLAADDGDAAAATAATGAAADSEALP